MPLSPNHQGALFMCVSQAAFTLNDTLVKLATDTVGIGQIMLVRGVFATVLITLLVWRLGHFPALRLLISPAVAVRIVGEIGGTCFFLIALSHLPLANVSAVFQSLPLAVTMGAALFFGEKVGPRRWLAIVIGFVGVVIIVRPGMEGFTYYSIYVLLSVMFCTVRDLATRHIHQAMPSTFISLLTAASVTVCGAVLLPSTGGWVALTPGLVAMLAGAAILVLIGYQFIIQSMRVGDISFIAPFRYSALLWAIGCGYLVFGNFPDMPMLVGSAIVVGSGIYTLYRERIVGKTKPAAESTQSAIAPDGI